MAKKQLSEVRKIFQSIKILFLGLLGGQVLFALVASFLVGSAKSVQPNDELSGILIYIIPIIIGVGMLGSNYLFKMRLESAKKENTLISKMEMYKSASILRYAFLEGPAMCCLVFFIITSNYSFLFLAMVVIALFVFYRPTNAKATYDLGLNPSEQNEIGL